MIIRKEESRTYSIPMLLNNLSIWTNFSSSSWNFSTSKLTFIYCAICMLISPWSVRFIILEETLVHIAISVNHPTFSICFPVEPVSFVESAINPYLHTLPIFLPVFIPFAFVLASVVQDLVLLCDSRLGWWRINVKVERFQRALDHFDSVSKEWIRIVNIFNFVIFSLAHHRDGVPPLHFGLHT